MISANMFKKMGVYFGQRNRKVASSISPFVGFTEYITQACVRNPGV